MATFLIWQVVEAVHHLHERNIIHRDVKPENILFAERHDEVTVKLTDFGLSAHPPAPPSSYGNLPHMATFLIWQVVEARPDEPRQPR